MLKSIILVTQLLILIMLTGCTSSQESSKFTFGKGKYKFLMSDSTGKKILSGTMNMTSKESDNISGTYEITNIYNKEFPALSIMDGEFSGNIIQAEKKVFINTNPRIADGNVFWNMYIKSNSVSGEWNYSVFRGSRWKGKVKITK